MDARKERRLITLEIDGTLFNEVRRVRMQITSPIRTDCADDADLGWPGEGRVFLSCIDSNERFTNWD